MGDVVNGYILSHSFGGKELEIFEHNVKSIGTLPKQGAYLIQPMFSTIPLEFTGHVNAFQIIHFAGVYGEMYGFENKWVKEFEDLLSKLSWCKAVVFQSYTGMRLEYIAKDHTVGSEAIPTHEWEVKGFDSYHNLNELNPSEAIC